MQNLIEHSLTNSIELKFKLDAQLWDVILDDGEFQDVILNLVINARDAMPEGGTFHMETRNCSIEADSSESTDSVLEDWVKLVVSDTGFGMDEATGQSWSL